MDGSNRQGGSAIRWPTVGKRLDGEVAERIASETVLSQASV